MGFCRLSSSIGVALIVLVAGASAAEEPTFGTSGLEEGRHGGALLPRAPCSFTQNLDPETLETGIGVACQAGGLTADTFYLRVFDLDGEHGLSGEVCVESVDYGVEQSLGNVPLTVRTYCAPQGTSGAFELDTATFVLRDSVDSIQPDAALEFFDVPVNGCCVAEEADLVVEIETADCLATGACVAFYPGGNADPQTKPWYIAAPDCGVDNPIDSQALGFADAYIVWRVNADCEGDVPASGGPGSMLIALAILAASAWLLRRLRPA
jgi:hypothetical protein